MKYTLKQDYKAYPADSERMNDPHLFKSGEEIEGEVYSGAGADELKSEVIVEENGFVIPSEVLKEFSQPESVLSEAEELQKELDHITGKNTIRDIVTKSKQSVNGLLIGGAIGGVTALAFRKSLVLGLIVGATIGGYIGAKITLPKDLQPKENK